MLRRGRHHTIFPLKRKINMQQIHCAGCNEISPSYDIIHYGSTDSCSFSAVLPGGVDKGWYMDLTAYGTGEQTVTSGIITGGLVAFIANRPIVNNASCSNALGEARGYWLNLLNGSGAIGVAGICGGARSSTFVGGGLPPSPVTGAVTIKGVRQNVVIGAVQRDGSASTSIGGQQLDPAIQTKRTRIYWRTATDTH